MQASAGEPVLRGHQLRWVTAEADGRKIDVAWRRQREKIL